MTSEIQVHTTGLTSQYIAQVTGDLEHNVKEQERLGAEIDASQQQLGALQHDHLSAGEHAESLWQRKPRRRGSNHGRADRAAPGHRRAPAEQADEGGRHEDKGDAIQEERRQGLIRESLVREGTQGRYQSRLSST
ncbi:hypothetical protein [Streptomyces sp. NPDC056983]|uniref:hypothetical protein n=1 Tax=Streptomyces sp. NPDC056983 TaxID=3345987 RepID=UPI003638E9FE